MCGSIGPVVLFFSKALIHGFKLISPLKIIHFLVSDWSLTINFFLWQPQSYHWFPGVLVMATKEDPAVNGHPGDDSTGRQQGSEGRGNKGEQGPGRAKNESNAQNRPKSEPNCCLLENGKRCTRPASNASYRWHSCIVHSFIQTKSKTNHTL